MLLLHPLRRRLDRLTHRLEQAGANTLKRRNRLYLSRWLDVQVWALTDDILMVEEPMLWEPIPHMTPHRHEDRPPRHEFDVTLGYPGEGWRRCIRSWTTRCSSACVR